MAVESDRSRRNETTAPPRPARAPAATRSALEALGHKLGETDGSFGGYQAILRDHEEGVYYGASEVRKDGQAAGY